MTIKDILKDSPFIGEYLLKWFEKNEPKTLSNKVTKSKLITLKQLIESFPESYQEVVMIEDGQEVPRLLNRKILMEFFVHEKKHLTKNDNLTTLLGLLHNVKDTYEIIEFKGLYKNIFKGNIKNLVNMLIKEIEKSNNQYLYYQTDEGTRIDIMDLINSLTSVQLHYSKLAYRLSEVDDETREKFYGYHSALMKMFGFPLSKNDTVCYEPLTIEDVGKLRKIEIERHYQEIESINSSYAQSVSLFKIDDVVETSKGLGRIFHITLNPFDLIEYHCYYLNKAYRRKKVNGEGEFKILEDYIISKVQL